MSYLVLPICIATRMERGEIAWVKLYVFLDVEYECGSGLSTTVPNSYI